MKRRTEIRGDGSKGAKLYNGTLFTATTRKITSLTQSGVWTLFFVVFVFVVCVHASGGWGGGGEGGERERESVCVCEWESERERERERQRQREGERDRFGKWAESLHQGLSQCTTVDGIVGCCVHEAALHTVTVHTCQVNRARPAAALMLQCPQIGLLVLVLAPFHPQHRQAGTWSG